MKKKNLQLLLTVFILSFVLFIGINVQRTDTGFLFDTFIMDKIYASRTVLGLSIMKILTQFGSKYFFLVALLFLGYRYISNMEREKAWMIILSIVGSYMLNALLKLTFARTRPIMYMAIEKTSYSFPSGHAMVSMSFYTTLTYIIASKFTDKTHKIAAYVLNFLIIAIIGYSRLYLGVHWPTDVIVGYLMGFLVFYLSKEKFGKRCKNEE